MLIKYRRKREREHGESPDKVPHEGNALGKTVQRLSIIEKHQVAGG